MQLELNSIVVIPHAALNVCNENALQYKGAVTENSGVDYTVSYRSLI
jgi:methyl coenzyme M reductase subunit C-like uncharacterized protein (methanogenesis marker protein 7)